jgi:transcriptional regulator with XRE-family HTH domain
MIALEKKQKAVALRKKGYSFREISVRLGIAQSTASVWLRGITLSQEANRRIHAISDNGRRKGLASNTKRRDSERKRIQEEVDEYLAKIVEVDPKVACALLYWGEGTKYLQNHSISFMNADPVMIQYFLRVFREGFKLDETKLRALVHLHEYHNVEKQQKFWSETTGIQIKQFNRSYIKPNTGKRKKENYPGCISIRYSDSKIYKEVMYIIEKLGKK